MSRTVLRFLISLAVCQWVVLFSAHGQAVPNLSNLVSVSDVVAVARVATVTQTGSGAVEFPWHQSIPAHFRVATLRLLEMLKGTASSVEVQVSHTILYSPGGWGGGVPKGYTIRDTLVPNSTRLVFLKRVGERYEFTDGSYLSVVCAPETGHGTEVGSAFDRVVSHISAAPFSASVPTSEKLEVIWQLRSVEAESVVSTLKRFLSGEEARGNQALRTEALAALLGGHHDQSVLDDAEAELLSGASTYSKCNLLLAFTNVVPPSRSGPVIDHLANSNPQLRDCVARHPRMASDQPRTSRSRHGEPR